MSTQKMLYTILGKVPITSKRRFKYPPNDLLLNCKNTNHFTTPNNVYIIEPYVCFEIKPIKKSEDLNYTLIVFTPNKKLIIGRNNYAPVNTEIKLNNKFVIDLSLLIKPPISYIVYPGQNYMVHYEDLIESSITLL